MNITGWWLTYPSERYESQLGWWNSQYGNSQKKFQSTNQISCDNSPPFRGDFKGTGLSLTHLYGFLVGSWATPLKNISSSAGMMKFPISSQYIYIWALIKFMFQTTNQSWSGHGMEFSYNWCFNGTNIYKWGTFSSHFAYQRVYTIHTWTPKIPAVQKIEVS